MNKIFLILPNIVFISISHFAKNIIFTPDAFTDFENAKPEDISDLLMLIKYE